MKCKKCGFENTLSAQYCGKCGIALKASVEEISAQSQAELKQKKKERIEQSLHTTLIIICILLIPLIFSYLFLPEPRSDEIFVTAPYAEAELADVSSIETVKFDEEPFLLQLPESSIAGSADYISVRTLTRKRDVMISFFNPDNKAQYSDIQAAAKWLAGRADDKGVWHKDKDDARLTALVLLALLSQGYSTADSDIGGVIKKALDSFYLKEQRDINTNKVEDYSLLLLAFIENTLLDPKCEYVPAITVMLNKLREHQQLKGEWKIFFVGKAFNRRDLLTTLCAMHTIAEAQAAGLCRLSTDEVKKTDSYLKTELMNSKTGEKMKHVFLRESWMLYILMLLNNGVIPDYSKSKLDTHIETVMNLEKELPPSLYGAHFLLMTLHRSGDRRTAGICGKLMGLYNNAFNKEGPNWPADTGSKIIYLPNGDSAAATAFLVRTYSFPFLFSRLK
ncbi:zinc ribbon domain-containing protein [Planctomycetota bacterium]